MSQLNRFRAFRQAIYEKVLTKEREAQFELLDALLASPRGCSFAELTLLPRFRRQWPSAYAALERGAHNQEALEAMLLAQLPQDCPVRLFALDESVWPHPEADTLPDRGYLYSGTSAAKRTANDGRGITIGHSYSTLAFIAEPGTSWTLPISTERVSSQDDAVAVGAEQVRRLCQGAGTETTLDVLCGDSRYGNHRFMGAMADLEMGVLVCLRRNRVLYRDPSPGQYKGIGRRPVHGAPFRFRDSSSWGDADQRIVLETTRFGQVELRLWHGLHAKEDHTVRFSVLCAFTHLERARAGKPLWLAWLAPDAALQRALPVSQLWWWYRGRPGIESCFRFRKQHLLWTDPALGTIAACDNWTRLVTLAQWQLYLARTLVEQVVLPWQRPQPERLTPERVKQSIGRHFAAFGTPARAPQRRGTSSGWPKGKPRKRRERHRVVRKPRKRRAKGKKAT